MYYSIKRTDEEIDNLMNRVGDQVNKGGSKYPGMTYEDGLREMLDWLTADEPEADPLE